MGALASDAGGRREERRKRRAGTGTTLRPAHGSGRAPTDVRGMDAGARVWCGGPGLGRVEIRHRAHGRGPLLRLRGLGRTPYASRGRQHGARAVRVQLPLDWGICYHSPAGMTCRAQPQRRGPVRWRVPLPPGGSVSVCNDSSLCGRVRASRAPEWAASYAAHFVSARP